MKTTSRSVRWREGQPEKLAEAALRVGLDPVDLVRAAADAIVAYIEAHNGRILLPLNFDETFLVMNRQKQTLYEPPVQQELNRGVDSNKRKTTRH